MQFLKLKQFTKHEVKTLINTTGDEFATISFFQNAGGTWTIEAVDTDIDEVFHQQVFVSQDAAQNAFNDYQKQYA